MAVKIPAINVKKAFDGVLDNAKSIDMKGAVGGALESVQGQALKAKDAAGAALAGVQDKAAQAKDSVTAAMDAVDIEKIFAAACALPYCNIDREEFLAKELKGRIDEGQLANALANGTVNADVPIDILDDIAKSAITLETSKVTALSAASGLPGGVAAVATVPADLAQFYAHVFRIAQKLAYIYGAKEIQLRDATQNELMLYLGVMFGVGTASVALTKIAASSAAAAGKKIAAKPLSKFAVYKIAKKILSWLGVNMTKQTVGKAAQKAIPVIGGVLSGGLTFATYRPMAKRLQKELSRFALMSPEDLAAASDEADVILAEYVDMTDDDFSNEDNENADVQQTAEPA